MCVCVSAIIVRAITQGLGISTPNLVYVLVLGSLRSLLFLDALQQMPRSLRLKQKKCCPSDNSRRTWHINSKLGMWVCLWIPEKPIVLDALQQMSRSLWLKQKKCCPSDNSRKDLVYQLQTWFVDWSWDPPEAYCF